jgi:hypothetical protein
MRRGELEVPFINGKRNMEIRPMSKGGIGWIAMALTIILIVAMTTRAAVLQGETSATTDSAGVNAYRDANLAAATSNETATYFDETYFFAATTSNVAEMAGDAYIATASTTTSDGGQKACFGITSTSPLAITKQRRATKLDEPMAAMPPRRVATLRHGSAGTGSGAASATGAGTGRATSIDNVYITRTDSLLF